MDKKITVKEFVSKYNSIANDANKSALVKRHVVVDYVPYEEKCNICKRILNATMKINVHGKPVFNQDSTAKLMLYILNLINSYTDIIVDFSHVLDDFNMLEKNDISKAIIEQIPSSEKSKMDTILELETADYLQNHRSIVGVIDDLASSFSFIFDALSSKEFNDKIKSIITKAK